MQAGDIVEVTQAHEPYYCVGDKAELIGIDPSGDWWGDFTINDKFLEPGKWCFMAGLSEFKRID